jgi:hypothetical protein
MHGGAVNIGRDLKGACEKCCQDVRLQRAAPICVISGKTNSRETDGLDCAKTMIAIAAINGAFCRKWTEMSSRRSRRRAHDKGRAHVVGFCYPRMIAGAE